MIIVDVLSLVAITLAIGGAAVSFYYARHRHWDKYYLTYAGVIFLYFAVLYSAVYGVWFGECFGDSTLLTYILRSGMLTRVGVIAMMGLLIGWIIAVHRGET